LRLPATLETWPKYKPPTAQPINVNSRIQPKRLPSELTSITDRTPNGVSIGILAVIRLETPTGNVRRKFSRLKFWKSWM
jgi:hypothetical protein